VLNTRSATWPALSAEYRRHAPLGLIRAHPTLMRRPLIKDGDTLCLGWEAATRAALGVG